jgi:radical SAM protein with 4Fe4S-binding SPASM domain
MQFVAGPRRGALYDMNGGRVYSVDPFTTRILKLGLDNVPVDEIPRRLRLGERTAKRKIFEAFLHHPFIRLSEAPNPPPSHPVVRNPHRLEFLWVELTATCNLRCQHCYASSGPNRAPGAMTGEDYLQLLRDAAAAGCETVQFTGGEIFLRSDLLGLVREARGLGIESIELYTNATLIRDADLDALEPLGVRFAISVYSHRPEHHDAITLVPGSWNRTVGNLRRLLERGFAVRVGVIRMEPNWDDMEGTRRYLTGLGVPEKAIGFDTVRPTGRGCEGGLAEPERSLIKLGPPTRFETENGRLSARTCWSGRLAVDPEGNAYPCVFSRKLPVGNVRESGLAALLGGEPVRDLWSITLEKVEDCRVCEYRYACFDCRLQAHARTGRMLAKPPTCAYRPAVGRVEAATGMPVRAEPLPQVPRPQVPKPRSGVRLRRVGTETYLWDRETKAMHVLNSTAAQIWEWCDGRSTRDEIVDRMRGLFGAGADRIRRDVGRTLDAFQELGLME